ncbi:MAG: hypothetical protein ABI548_13130, partial [Polyangiaceae bacterium]
MKKTPFPFLFSCLSLVALFVMSCGSPARQFGKAAGGGGGSGGEGEVVTSGGSRSTAGDRGTGGAGTM